MRIAVGVSDSLGYVHCAEHVDSVRGQTSPITVEVSETRAYSPQVDAEAECDQCGAKLVDVNLRTDAFGRLR